MRTLRLFLISAILVLFLPILTFSQEGPMGIGNKDGTPTSAGPQPKLLLWLDGSSARGLDTNGEPTLYQNNMSVDVWLDKSGNDHHFTQPIGQQYNPTLYTSGGNSGPKGVFTEALPTPVVRFRQQNEGQITKLVCENFQLSGSGYSIFFVVRNDGNNKYGLFNYSTGAHDNAMLIYNDNGIRHVMADTYERTSDIGELSGVPSGGNRINLLWNYGGMAWSNASNNSNRDWEYNRIATTELYPANRFFNPIPSISNIGTASIGDFINIPGGQELGTFDVDIAEIIIFEGKVTRPVSRLIRNYFWIKYGINGASNAWDYFHANMLVASGANNGRPWGGKFYAPIGIGTDIRTNTPGNPGAIHEARSAGLVLRVNEGNYPITGSFVSFLIAAPHGNSLSGLESNVVTEDVPGLLPDVMERWERMWEICGRSTSDDDQIYEIAFDFPEGISGGQIPQNVENFELIYRQGNPNSGNFSILPVEEKFITSDEVVFRVRKEYLKVFDRYYTIGTRDNMESSLTGDLKRTWRAYKNGNWHDPLVWTLDGSSLPAYVNPNGQTPKLTDNVYIGAGKTVTVTTDISEAEIGIMDQLHVIGTLELAATATKPTFLSISGSGVIRCAADNFPIGNADDFADPLTGGTLELYGAGGFTISSDLTVNNLLVNLSGSVDTTVTLAANLTHHGLFEVRRGSFIVSDNSPTIRTINSYGTVFVANARSRIRTQSEGNFGHSHNWYFHGDLRNTNGRIKFTGRGAPVDSVQAHTYYTTGEAGTQKIIAHFVSGSANQELVANGISHFARIVVDKGTDMTYILRISSNGANKFRLLGRCDQYMHPARPYSTLGQNGNSLALINGTAEIGQNIFIPLLANANTPSNKWYMLNNTVQLWVNGGEVAVGSLGGITTSGDEQRSHGALIIYGLIKVSAGNLSSYCDNGILLRQTGMLQVDGGTVSTNQLRTSYVGASNIGGLIVNGGTLHINPDHWVGHVTQYAALSLKEQSNVFTMAGGTIYITAPTSRGVIFINTDPQNNSITGGTVHLNTIDNSSNYKITSRSPFWNLTLSSNGVANTNSFRVMGGQSGGVGDDTLRTLLVQDLIVFNKLLIKGGSNGPKLKLEGDGYSSDASSHLYIYGDLEIENGGSLITNENTVHFVGSSNSSLILRGSGANPYPFFNVVVNKDMDSRNVNIQNTGPNPVMNILGNLNLERGSFINGNRHVELKGNLINRTHFGDHVGNGELRMIGTESRQDIESHGGTIRNLTIDNPDGVALLNSELTIRNSVKFTNGSFFIGDNKLRIESTITNPFPNANSTTKFVVCSGNASAGGLEILNHSATQTLNFPIGVNTSDGLKYTSAEIQVNSGWIGNGFIRITPVDTLLNTSDLSGGEDYLAYYWKVTASEYESRPNVSHRFLYAHLSDVRGDVGNFVAGRVLNSMPFTRSYDDSPTPANSHISTTGTLRYIFYNGSDLAQSMDGNGTPLADADYSAGAADRFPIGSQPDIYFSKNTAVGAVWNLADNWNKLSECVGCTSPHSNHSSSQPATSGFPGAGDIAVIGFDASNSYRPHIYKAPSDGIEAAQIVFTPLQDADGNRLPRYNGNAPADIGILRPCLQLSNTNDIIKVGQIAGEGQLMLVPPNNGDIDLGVTDIGNFLVEDSSVVVFKPSNANVRNLSFLPGELPNFFIAQGIATLHTDVQVRGNLEIAGTGKIYLSDTQNGNINVLGNLILDQYQASSANTWLLYNKKGTPKTVEVHGDLKLSGAKAYIGVNTDASSLDDEPWTPNLISPLLWFDASTGITTDGDEVTAWQSQGTSNFTAAQSESDKRPIYQTGINGLNTINFDGTDDFLRVSHHSSLNLPANQNFEIFSVTQTTNVYNECETPSTCPSQRVIMSKGASASNGYMLYVSATSGTANTIDSPNHKYRFYMQGANVAIAPNVLGTGANFGWVRRQGNNGHIYNTTGGSASLGTVGSRSYSGNHNLTLGAAFNGTDRFMDGQIGEIIFIKRTLSQEERQKMEGYLAHKWGMENDLPVGHPYRNKIPMVNDALNTTARLIVHGNIIQNLSSGTLSNNGIKLYDEADSTFVELVLTGSGHHEYDLQSGPRVRLWKMTIDKGDDYTNSSFAFNAHTEISGPSNELIKSVNIRNGLLKFNHPDINFTLSSGGGNFIIPASGGLEINAGDLEIKGLETGLIHSGLLKITGGSLVLGDAIGSNNFIEYAGTPRIEITGGNLTVGSQIRRNLSNTSGALDYRQSGGEVIIGKFSAPSPTRAMLEVVNSGSRFEHTGGTLTFVQGINTGAVASLRIEPTNHNVGGTAEIIVGNADSPVGSHIQNFGIQSNIPLNSLTINSNNGPGVHLISHNLELNGDLTIHSGATLDGLGWDLTIHGNLTNDGLLNFAPGTVNLVHPLSGTVSGSGIFNLNDLNRTGSSGITTVETNLLVTGNFTTDEGEMDFGENSITVLKNATSDGKLSFDSGAGLVLQGTTAQQFEAPSGNTEIDILTISNSHSGGVFSPEDFSVFKINKNLRLDRGRFSLNGNTLEMAQGASFTQLSPYGETNMIITGAAAINSGILLHFPADYTGDVFVPLGIDRFMPINLDFSQPEYSSGTTASSYRLQLSIPAIAIALDSANVLDMFFSVDATGIGIGVKMDMVFHYNNQYVLTQPGFTEEDYIGARAYGQDVWKFPGIVDPEANTITFHHDIIEEIASGVSGDYFAGVDEAIPADIDVYTTTSGGLVQNDIYDEEVPGGGAPSGAVVIIKHSVNVAIDNISFYQTVIDSGAVLTINSSDRHRFGRVSGKGTLRLVNSGTLPSGNYAEFFGCGGGKIDYHIGSGPNLEILANMPPLEEVIISGENGVVTIASSAVNVCRNLRITGSGVTGLSVSAANSNTLTVGENLIVEGGTFDLRQGNTVVHGDVIITNTFFDLPPLVGVVANTGKLYAGNSGNLTIEGDLRLEGASASTWINFGTAFRETHLHGDLIRTGLTGVQGGIEGAKVVFDGTAAQTIQGEFTGANKIPSIELNNSEGLYLDGNVEVSENLILTDGNIFTDASNMLSIVADDVQIQPEGGRPTSFIDGPVQWALSNTGAKRIFPVGKKERYRPLAVSESSAARIWEVEYNDTIARVEPTIQNQMLPDPTNIPAIERVSIQEYWRVKTDAGSTTAKIQLSWGDSSAVSTNTVDQSKLLVLAYNTGTQVWDSYGGTDFQFGNSGSVNSVDPISFSERFLTLGSSDALNPLPVTWLYFTGENVGNDHRLSWATSTERNNDYFELERSLDAQDWVSIARITAIGHSTTKQTYNYTDNDAPYGRVYYRIKQVDFDTKQDYAPNVVSLERGFSKESEKFDFLLYPNPSQIGTVRFRMASMADVRADVSIYDLSGKFLSQSYVQVDGQGTSAPINCNLEPGIYLVTVIVNDKMRSKPLVITK